MLPNEHIDWLDDNVHWFENLPLTSLGHDVPNCPGWTVERVVTHLAFGMGMAYPYALRTPADATDDQPWADVPWPRTLPTGKRAIQAFAEHMDACVELFRSTDPDMPCWTYDDTGRAAFWFRRAAIETALHRIDVAEALGLRAVIINQQRVLDGIEDAVEFAIPLAAKLDGDVPDGAVSIRVGQPGDERVLTLGDGGPVAEISGESDVVFAALWGRHRDLVQITGERAVAERWMSLVESGFAGR